MAPRQKKPHGIDSSQDAPDDDANDSASDAALAAALTGGGRPYATEIRHELGLPPDTIAIPVSRVPELTACAIHQDTASEAWKRCREKHAAWFASDIRTGALRISDPDTNLEYWPSDVMTLDADSLGGALVSVSAFAQFARSIGIDVWIQSAGTPDNDPAKPELADATEPSTRKSKAPKAFQDALEKLLQEIEERAAAEGKNFSRYKMPGTKEQLQVVANKFDGILDDKELGTFDEYIEGICRFKGGRPRKNDSNFYADLFPEYFNK